jgi:membrane protein
MSQPSDGAADRNVGRLRRPVSAILARARTAGARTKQVLGGLSLAASVQSLYARIFRLQPFGLRGIPAQAVWLCGLIVFLATTTSLGARVTGTVAGQVCYGLATTTVLALFLWAGARVLTVGRLSWRASWPTALFTTIGLTGLGVVSRLAFSASIVTNESNYGGIGVVFTILSWLIGFSVVLIGGAVVGVWCIDSELSVVGALRRLSVGRRTGLERARKS